MPRDAAPRALLEHGRGALSRWLRPTLDARAGTGLLTGEQLATLRAFAEVIVAGAPLAPDEWEPIRTFLIAAARTQPGYAALCAGACRMLDGLAGGAFVAVPPVRRWTLVQDARLGERPVPRHELLVVGRRVEHAVRELLVPDLVRAYFDGPAGWAVVGYAEPLGECRDPFGYTEAP